jgi:hypothetical protein
MDDHVPLCLLYFRDGMRLQSQLLSEKRFDEHLDLFLSVAANNSLRRLDASGIHTRHFAANLLYLRP